MGLPNLKLRGGSYHWRRKITVGGMPLPLCISLRTGHFARARLISDRLGVAIEELRVAYGQSTGLSREHLRRVFSDALRWQLQRIEEDQAGSAAAAVDHADINSLYVEAWEFFARAGIDGQWTLDEHARLISRGWSAARARKIAELVFDLQTGGVISGSQLDAYSSAFGITMTRDNRARVTQMICRARAAACREATLRLPPKDDEVASWIDDAIADESPFAFQRGEQATMPPGPEPTYQDRTIHDGGIVSQPPEPRSKKRLVDAGEECILLHEKAGAWDAESAKQVRTALRLFDHACGTGAFIEDLVH